MNQDILEKCEENIVQIIAKCCHSCYIKEESKFILLRWLQILGGLKFRVIMFLQFILILLVILSYS